MLGGSWLESAQKQQAKSLGKRRKETMFEQVANLHGTTERDRGRVVRIREKGKVEGRMAGQYV